LINCSPVHHLIKKNLLYPHACHGQGFQYFLNILYWFEERRNTTDNGGYSFVLDFSFVSFLCIKTKKRKELKNILYWFEEKKITTDNEGGNFLL